VQDGDYIEFHRNGHRIRQAQHVHRGRKHNYVRFAAFEVETFKNRTVGFAELTRVWRKIDGK
jgi:hypothetical protein